MKRQKVRSVFEDHGSAVEYFPKAIKLVVNGSTYYGLSDHILETSKTIWQADLFSLPSSPNSDNEVEPALIEKGVKTGLRAIFFMIRIGRLNEMTVQIIDPLQDGYLHILFLEGDEFMTRFTETLKS